MLSPSTRDKIKEILSRVAKGDLVSLDERVFIHEIADKDQSINSWLKRARRFQQNDTSNESIDKLLTDLDIGSMEPNSQYKPDQDDIADWFQGAPSWVTRS